MKTYFVSSDIHGFFSPWMESLSRAGFQFDNPEHILILLGDIFDRGEENRKVYSFLRAFPKERRILVLGNHELLLLDLLRRGFAFDYDYSNGTVGTLSEFAYGFDGLKAKIRGVKADAQMPWAEKTEKVRELDSLLRKRLFEGKAIREVAKWVESDEWVRFYETGRYVFVHAWVPLSEEGGLPAYDPNWRKASKESWADATWGCPYHHYKNGLWDRELAKGKTLVCGHWHTSDFYNQLDYADMPEKQLDIRISNPIYRSEKYKGLIGLDACTALTKTVNVLVLKESEL